MISPGKRVRENHSEMDQKRQSGQKMKWIEVGVTVLALSAPMCEPFVALSEGCEPHTGCSGFKTRSKKFSASIFFLRVSSRVFCLPFFVNIVFITSHNKIFLIILVCFVLCKNKSLKFLSSQEHHKTHFPRFYFYFLVSENLDIKTQNKNIQLAC